MNIVGAKKEDIPSILSLCRTLFLEDYSEEFLLREIEENPCAQFYAIKEEDEVIGFIDFYLLFDSSSLAILAVKENYQRQGIGTKLLDFMFDQLKENNVLFNELEVRESNQKAISFYEKYGYQRMKIKPNYYTNGDNAYWYVKGVYDE